MNVHGKRSYFIVHTERSIEEWIAMYGDEHDVSEIASGKKIPFFGLGKEAWEFEAAVWQENFYEFKILLGREKYFCKFLPF